MQYIEIFIAGALCGAAITSFCMANLFFWGELRKSQMYMHEYLQQKGRLMKVFMWFMYWPAALLVRSDISHDKYFYE